MKEHDALPFSVDQADGGFNRTAGTAVEAGMPGFVYSGILFILSANIDTIGDICAYF